MATEVKVNMKPISEIETGLGIQNGGPAHAYFTERCADYMREFMPYNEGYLSEKNVVKTVDEITYNSPYAHYMYEGKVMGPNIPIEKTGDLVTKWISKKPKYYTGKDIDYSKSQAQAGHTYAGPYWDKRMWSARKEQIEEEVTKFIRLRGGRG